MPPSFFVDDSSDDEVELRPQRTSALSAIAGGWVTPGWVAREAGVTARTVRNWCDCGLLRSERLPSGHRRIAASSWAKLKAGGLPCEIEQRALAREESEALERRFRNAATPQEAIEILMGRA